MASPPKKEPRPSAKPDSPPRPGSLPKLPQTIFNLERKGGKGGDDKRQRRRS